MCRGGAICERDNTLVVADGYVTAWFISNWITNEPRLKCVE